MRPPENVNSSQAWRGLTPTNGKSPIQAFLAECATLTASLRGQTRRIPPYDSFFIGAKTKDLLSAYPMGKVARLISRKIDNGLDL